MEFRHRPLILRVLLSAVLVFVALQFSACDEKSSSESTEAATGKTESSKTGTESGSKESLAAIAQRLVSEGRVRMSGDLVAKSHAKNRPRADAYHESDAETLLHVARYTRIFIFVHGFEAEQWGGKPRASAIEKAWAGHLKMLDDFNSGPFASIMFRHNTLDGFGAGQPQLGNLLFALRWLTDDPRLYNKGREIVVVAHSGGGNYAKDAYLRFQSHLKRSGAAAGGRADTTMRFVFLATPHWGTDVTLKAATGAALFNLLRSPGPHSEIAALKARYSDMATSRGFQQLRPNNRSLRQLNSRFTTAAKEAGNVELVSFWGVEDRIVPFKSAQLEGALSLACPGYGHSDLLNASKDAKYKNVLLQFYGLLESQPEFAAKRKKYQSNPARVGLEPGAKPRFGSGVRTERAAAIQNYMMSRLAIKIPDPEGTLGPIADRIDAKISAARISGMDKGKYWFGQWNGRPTFKLFRINDGTRSSRQGEVVQARYGRL